MLSKGGVFVCFPCFLFVLLFDIFIRIVCLLKVTFTIAKMLNVCNVVSSLSLLLVINTHFYLTISRKVIGT